MKPESNRALTKKLQILKGKLVSNARSFVDSASVGNVCGKILKIGMVGGKEKYFVNIIVFDVQRGKVSLVAEVGRMYCNHDLLDTTHIYEKGDPSSEHMVWWIGNLGGTSAIDFALTGDYIGEL